MNDNGMSPADIKAVMGDNNYPYPFPYMGGFGGSGFGGADGGWAWLIIILALLGGFNGNGFGGGFGGFNNDFAWLSNGQKEIMQNTNTGFDTLHLSNQMEGTRDAITNLTNAVTNGFNGVEISANNRQMADMQQNFDLSRQFSDCCCENRLATVQTQNIVQNEANATRFADANNTRDIITNATRNTQSILDKLCQLELDGVKAQVDAKNDKIDDLQRQLTMADLRASQTAQNAFISQGFANEVDALYNRLNSCPVPTTPVYGRTAIFSCNNNGGCGCNNGNATLF